MKIGFFDSGIGGLSVLHHAMKILPQEEFIFFADEDNVPYGTKSPEEVLRFVDEAFKFLIAQEVSAIVVACNTATSVAVRKMREKYSLPIIGMEPALKVALDLFPNRKVLVTATAITITGEKIRRLIKKLHAENLAELKALSQLVEFAERQEFNSAAVEEYLRGELENYDLEKFSSLVLGCTHFNYFKDTLRKILPPHVKILDGNAGTVNELIRRTNLQSARAENLPSIKFFYSGRLVTDSAELARLEKFLRRLDEMEAIF
ncbi:MAG: glutamate racemase [Selenomonadaceae bacterium]|nr:glutamate racemase [Selenomonadaceae bacterium]